MCKFKLHATRDPYTFSLLYTYILVSYVKILSFAFRAVSKEYIFLTFQKNIKKFDIKKFNIFKILCKASRFHGKNLTPRSNVKLHQTLRNILGIYCLVWYT